MTVDGQVVEERLDGKAVPIDPGEHVVRFETAGANPGQEAELLVTQGEKNRKVVASFLPPKVAPPPTPVPTTEPAKPQFVLRPCGKRMALRNAASGPWSRVV